MTALPSIVDEFIDVCRVEAVSEDCRLITNRRIRYFWAGRRHAWHVPAVNDDRTPDLAVSNSGRSPAAAMADHRKDPAAAGLGRVCIGLRMVGKGETIPDNPPPTKRHHPGDQAEGGDIANSLFHGGAF